MGKTYTVKEVAEALEFSTNTVYKYLNEGKIKATRLGTEGRFRIPEKELGRLLGLKGEKAQLGPQLEKTEAVVEAATQTPATAVAKIEETPIIEPNEQFALPSFFDWFVALIAIFVGVAHFLSPSYLLDASTKSFVSIIGLIKVALFIGAAALIGADLLRFERRVWHRNLYLLLIVLFGSLGLILLATGNLISMIGGIAMALTLVTALTTKLNDFLKFILFILIVMVTGGVVILVQPTAFPAPTAAEWIGANKTLFGFLWYGFLLLYFIGYFWAAITEKIASVMPFALITAAGSFGYAAWTLLNGFRERPLYAILVGTFALVAPFWRKINRYFLYITKKIMLIGFVWFSVILAVGVGIIFYLRINLENYLTAESHKRNQIAAELIDSSLNAAKSAVSKVATDPELRSALTEGRQNPDELGKLIKVALDRTESLEQLVLVSAEGKLIARYPSDMAANGPPITTETLKTLQQSSRPVVSYGPLPGNSADRAGVVISSPILSPAGLFVGALSGVLDQAKLIGELRDIRIGNLSRFIVTDRNRQLIFATDQTTPAGTIYQSEVKAASVLEGKPAEAKGYNRDGQLSLKTVAPVPSADWLVFSSQPLVGTIERNSLTALTIFFVIIFMGIGSLVVSVLLLKKLS